MSISLDLQRLRATVLQLKQEIAMRPIRVPTRGGSSATPNLVLSVLGGNTLTAGIDGIKYAAIVTPAAVYDPDVTIVYPVGLGRGLLYTDGVLGTKNVLIRHKLLAYTGPVIRGQLLPVLAKESLVYGTGLSAVTMTVYTFGVFP